MRLRSARDLKLQTRWRYGFVPYNHKAVPLPGVLFMDVGGGPGPGILDHHSGDPGFECSAAVVLNRPDWTYTYLLEPWLQRVDDGRLSRGALFEPLLVTHVYPDWDACVAAVLIQHLIEEGFLPPLADNLVELTADIDQGRWRLTSENRDSAPLALLVASDQNGTNHEAVMRIGMDLVRTFLSSGGDIQAWTREPRFAGLHAALQQQEAAYQRDKANADLDPAFPVPAADGQAHLKVPAFLLRERTQCDINKYFVRADGYPLFLCLDFDKRKQQEAIIISLDPAYSQDGRKPTLKGLGHRLELEEIQARKLANHGHDNRPGPPRWPDGICTNKDPWYDGRDKQFTMVQTPNGGSLLPLSLVRDVLQTADYADTKLIHAELVLVWSEQVASHSGSELPGYPLRRIERSRNETTYGADLKYPRLPALRVQRIEWSANMTLERLVNQGLAEASSAGRSPDFTFARVVPETGAASDRVEYQLRRLARARLHATVGAADSPITLTGSHQLLRAVTESEWSHDPDHPQARSSHSSLGFLYAAFLHETLVAFSREVAEPNPAANVAALRAAFVDFHARFYRRELTLGPAAQDSFDSIFRVLQIPEHIEEIHNELARLAEIQQEKAQQKQETAQRRFENLGYLISFFGVLQTIFAFFSLTPGYHPGWVYTTCFAAVALSSLALTVVRGILSPKRPLVWVLMFLIALISFALFQQFPTPSPTPVPAPESF